MRLAEQQPALNTQNFVGRSLTVNVVQPQCVRPEYRSIWRDTVDSRAIGKNSFCVDTTNLGHHVGSRVGRCMIESVNWQSAFYGSSYDS